jgi:hypothetical protein
MADGYTGVHTRRGTAASSSPFVSRRDEPESDVRLASSPKSSIVAETAFGTEHLAKPPAGLVSGLRTFAAEHGGATAAIEYAGRKGARIVVVGGDGSTGHDQYADSTEAARAACLQAGVSIEHEWERELTEQMTASKDLWGRGRRVLTR